MQELLEARDWHQNAADAMGPTHSEPPKSDSTPEGAYAQARQGRGFLDGEENLAIHGASLSPEMPGN